MIYPNGRILHYGYDNSTLDNAVGRTDYIADDNGSGGVGTHLEEYSYLGLSTVVQETRPQSGVSLSYLEPLGGDLNTSGGDQYTGLDQFGEVVDQNWQNGSTGTSTDRFQYGYDADGNVLYKNNLVDSWLGELYHAQSATSGDDATAYDALNRLQAFSRGNLFASGNNGSGLDSSDESSVPTVSYGLDGLGNLVSSTTGGTVTVSGFSDNNEQTYAGSTTATLTYDANGNTLDDAAGNVYTYDAWNRLMTATPSGTLHEEFYTYNALGDRVTDLDGVNFGSNPVVLVINDGNIQRSMVDSLTSVFSQSVTSFSSGAITLSQVGGGSITFNTPANPSGDHKTWLITFPYSGVSSTGGSLADGGYTLTVTGSDVNYTAGGTMSSNQTFTFHRLLGDMNGDGHVNGIDLSTFNPEFGTTATTFWYMDFDGNGSINGTDFATISSNYGHTESTGDSGPILEGLSTTEGMYPGITVTINTTAMTVDVTGKTYLGVFAPRQLFYSTQDQVIQENAQNPNGGAMQVAVQYVWGLAYVNEEVLRDRDADGSSSTGTYVTFPHESYHSRC